MKPTQQLLAAREVFTSFDTQVRGLRIRARRSTVLPRRSGPAAVLIGGTALSGRYLLPTAVELARRIPVWVPDLAGRGASEGPGGVPDVEQHADLLASWMDSAGLERVALLGNSMGCQVAGEVAARHPERVSHLILQGPTTDAQARTLPRQLLRLLAVGTREPMSLGPLEVVDWLRAGVRYAAGSVRSTLRHRIEDVLPHVTCPALVVRGSRDLVVPERWAARVRDLLPDGQLRVIPGAAHALVYTHGLELARVTDAFLERHAER
jgi:2-hydroxy-6-oxonona-2,4-dienedioate hydrolase